MRLHESRHTTALPQKYPRNAESADHSAFYLNAIAIKDRAITPASYAPEKFTDPVILDLIERITVDYDPDLPEWGQADPDFLCWAGSAAIHQEDDETLMENTAGITIQCAAEEGDLLVELPEPLLVDEHLLIPSRLLHDIPEVGDG